jgi:hypothetical protein
MYHDYQFIPLCICATSYFACQLHGDFALSMKRRLCTRRPNISFIFNLALACLHSGKTTLNFVIKREEKNDQSHVHWLKNKRHLRTCCFSNKRARRLARQGKNILFQDVLVKKTCFCLLSLKFYEKRNSPPVKNQTTRIRLNCELRTLISFQNQSHPLSLSLHPLSNTN